MATIHHLHRQHSVRGLTPAEVEYLRRDLAPIRAQHELKRLRQQMRDRQERRERLRKLVAVGAVIVAWFCILYFAFQMGRGL